ncbi:hypothetical protein GGI22_004414, partial [Coemansia erecta]
MTNSAANVIYDARTTGSTVSTNNASLKSGNKVGSEEFAEDKRKESTVSLDESQNPVRPADCAF